MPIVAAVVAALLHLVVGFFYLTSGLVAPGWAVVGLLIAWGALALLLAAWARRRSYWVLSVPVVALALLVAVLSAGGAWLGWTA